MFSFSMTGFELVDNCTIIAIINKVNSIIEIIIIILFKDICIFLFEICCILFIYAILLFF